MEATQKIDAHVISKVGGTTNSGGMPGTKSCPFAYGQLPPHSFQLSNEALMDNWDHTIAFKGPNRFIPT